MYQGNKNLENVGLGIDLGGTKIAGALFNPEGIVSPKKVLYLENKTGQEVGEQIFNWHHVDQSKTAAFMVD